MYGPNPIIDLSTPKTITTTTTPTATVFETPDTLNIIVHHGTVIDALTVDMLKIGGSGGRGLEIAIPGSEKITEIEFGNPSNTHWPTGTMCAFTIHTDLNKYGPYSPRSDCKNISTIKIPADMSFGDFFEKNAKQISNRNAETITFDMD